MPAGDERHQDLVEDALLPDDPPLNFGAKARSRGDELLALQQGGGAAVMPSPEGLSEPDDDDETSASRIEPSTTPTSVSDRVSSRISQPRSLTMKSSSTLYSG